jgi:hypothetical protein
MNPVIMTPKGASSPPITAAKIPTHQGGGHGRHRPRIGGTHMCGALPDFQLWFLLLMCAVFRFHRTSVHPAGSS